LLQSLPAGNIACWAWCNNNKQQANAVAPGHQVIEVRLQPHPSCLPCTMAEMSAQDAARRAKAAADRVATLRLQLEQAEEEAAAWRV
jgi:hypothetical protein